MMIVVAIVGILAAVAVPDFILWNQKHKLKSEVSNLAGTLAFARMTAINQNTPVLVNVSQVPLASVIVTFASPAGATMLPTITMDRSVRLTDAAGNAAVSPQNMRFNNMGTWMNIVNVNNKCIDGFGTASACPSTSQVLNFRSPGSENYRIVVLATGKIIWCYIPTCIQ
jgi:type IV pilus modification protein PilV